MSDILGIYIFYSCVTQKIGFSKNEKFAKLPHLKPLVEHSNSDTAQPLCDHLNLHMYLKFVFFLSLPEMINNYCLQSIYLDPESQSTHGVCLLWCSA